MKLTNYSTSIILAVSFVLTVLAFWALPSLAFIAFIALLLHLLLKPLVDRLNQHLASGLSSAIVLGGFLILMAGWFTIISSKIIPNFLAFITDLPELTKSIQSMEYFQISPLLSDEFNNLWGEIMSASMTALKSSLGILLSLFSKIIDFVIIIFVTFYMLKDGDEIKEYLTGLFPKESHDRVLTLFNRILKALRVYVCSQLLICFITGFVVFIYFTMRELPYASVFAAISGVAEFIPVLGPTMASAFAILMTTTHSIPIALQTAVFFLVLTQINHNIVYPTLIGKNLDLHPIAIILGVILGGELLGAPGMFLAVPVIVICKHVISDIWQNKTSITVQNKEQH